MSPFLKKKNELFDGILQLKEDEIQDPMKVLEQFFNDYRLHEWRDMLRTMVETCMTTENTEFSEPSERADLLHRKNDLERLLEANSLLLQQRRPADNKSTPL